MKAFPCKEYVVTNDPETMGEVHHPGMDLRDYFAAKALPQMIQLFGFSDAEFCAEKCYKLADAMLKAREQ